MRYAEQTVQCLDDNAASEFASGSLAPSLMTRVETHLAGCRDCRALVAALAGDEADSNAATHKHDKISDRSDDSQVGKRPVLSIGDRVGRYLVLSSLGAGGMGVVFAAYDPQLDRKVALKLLRANLGANAKEARTRLKREAQAIAQLNHPNVVGVYDVGTTDDGDVYIAMEFVEGDTLTTWLKRWPRTWREILEVFQQAARGLMAAHSVGLLHRDFKPDNVLVGGDGRVRVTDFGLARSLFLDDSNRGAITAQTNGRISQSTPAAGSPLQVDLTATGTVLGTPRYMPPEQLMGPTIDARADQFSFCVALYEALYNTHPLPGATSVSMLEHGEKALPPPEGTKVPAMLGRAVMRGLEKDRSKRFPTLGALMHELTPPPQRSPARFIAMAAVGALVVTGATAAVMTRDEQPIRRDGNDDVIIKRMHLKIQELEKERDELKNILLQKDVDLKELPALKERLAEKDEEIQQLVVQLVELRQQQQGAAQIVRRPESKQITTAIGPAAQSVQFCLGELDSRAYATEGAPKSRDYIGVVRLITTPEGQVARVPSKDGPVDRIHVSGLEYAPSVSLCIRDALARVQYPKASEPLKIAVDIVWQKGTLRMTGRLLQDGEPTGGTLDDL